MSAHSVYTSIELLVRVATALDETVVTQHQDIAIVVSPGDDPLKVYAQWRNQGGKVR